MRDLAPSNEILSRFGVKLQAVPFEGGLHGAFRAEDLVFKRTEEPEVHAWLCENVLSLQFSDLRVMEPVLSTADRWTEENWYAYRFLPGISMDGSLATKLRISRIFHETVKDVSFSGLSVQQDNPWSRAEKVVFYEESIPRNLSDENCELIQKLIKLAGRSKEQSHYVQVDFCGNILTDSTLPPAVIDLNLSYRPILFAEAVLIYDAVLWGDGNFEDVTEWISSKEGLHELVRAAAYRLLITSEFDQRFSRRNFELESGKFNSTFGRFTEALT